jgi:hypothetical protein
VQLVPQAIAPWQQRQPHVGRICHLRTCMQRLAQERAAFACMRALRACMAAGHAATLYSIAFLHASAMCALSHLQPRPAGTHAPRSL